MEALVFETPGEIDLRSFTTFGINAKPNTKSPIGYFGTGLKYAVAVLCRLGSRVTVFTAGEEYEFYSNRIKFRDTDFDIVRMRRRKDMFSRWRYNELPFTTQLGKNWEPWQVFRELESNTRDENGNTFLTDANIKPDNGQSMIVVTDPQVIASFHKMNEIFLPEDIDQRMSEGVIDIFNAQSKHVYYRGLRVMDISKPSLFTYNFTGGIELTEDRTLKYPFLMKQYLLNQVMQSQDRKLIDSILDANEEEYFEGTLEFDEYNSTAGPTFMSVVNERREKGLHIPSRVSTYYDRYYVSEDDEFQEIEIKLKRSEWKSVLACMEALGGEDKIINMIIESKDWNHDDYRLSDFGGFLYLVDKEVGE